MSAATTGQQARCPSCGAPIRFGGAHSLAAICAYCRSAVARRGVDVALIGKVPDLVATDTRLALGLTGRVGASTFTVLGHLQLSRVANFSEDQGGHAGDGTEGDAAWDEWYCGFSDGTWGWLAEAQGRLHLTRPVEGRAPTFPFEALSAGHRIDERGIGVLAVEEVGLSRFVTAEGELPFSPALGGVYRYADLSAADGRFFTFDYGAEGDDTADAVLFSGRRLGYEEAGLADRAPASAAMSGATVEGEALSCPHCAAPLQLKLATSESVTCPSCRSLLDTSSGTPRFVQALHSRAQPPIPLGAKGELDGEALEVLGWMRRSTESEGVTYYWDEYLLHGKRGYRWLTEGEGQWHVVAPIDAGRVSPERGVRAVYGGATFKHFQDAAARYEEIQGEFYWRVSAKRRVAAADYVAPPYILSSENDGQEESWSYGRWLAPAEVWSAFRLAGAPPPASGVGAAQPNPHRERLGPVGRVAALATVAHVVLLILVGAALPGAQVLAVDVPIGAAVPAPAPAGDVPLGPDADPAAAPTQPSGVDSQVFVSDPFELPASRQAVEIRASADCEQSWIGLDTAIINDDSGESDAVGIDLSYYHGYEGGESWSEGSRSGTALVGGLKRGRYLIRIEPQFGKDVAGQLPPSVHVVVTRGPFLATPAIVVFLLLLAWPLILFLRSRGFEKRRWNASDHPMTSSS